MSSGTVRGAAMIMVFTLLAGCVDGADPEPVEDTAPEPGPDPEPLVVAGPVESGNGTAGGFSFQADGAAGSYLVAFHPLPGSPSEIETDVSYHVTAPGASVAFFVSPTVVWGDADGWDVPRFWPFEQSVLTVTDGSFEASREGTSRASSSRGIAGYFTAFAADAPWTFEAEYVWGDGPVARPAYFASGGGATFRIGGDVLGAPGGAGAGRASIEAPVPGDGWTHIEIIDQPFEPVEVREYGFTLANGHEVRGTSVMYGYYALGGQAFSMDRVDYVGSLADTEGSGSAEVTYAAGSLGVDLGYVHLPLQNLPDGLAGADYSGSTWPFPERLPVPPSLSIDAAP